MRISDWSSDVCSSDLVDRAVAAAKQAFEGPWRKIPPWERAALLRKFADLYATRVDALAEIETRDNGRAVRESRGDIGMHAQYYHWFASLADRSEEHTSELQSLMRISYAVFCLTKKKTQ